MNRALILIIGKTGQIGWELERSLSIVGETLALDRQSLDLVDPDNICAFIRRARPGVIINAGAYTDVDRAESEPELAMAINGTAPGILAEEAKRLGALFIHYSTDYIFDGAKQAPYTENDMPNPPNVYGKTKLAGERSVQAVGGKYLVIRTGWVYGLRGRNFLTTVLRLLQEKEELRIVDDQIGSPTWARMISEATSHMVVLALRDPNQLESGLRHLTAAGQTSWYGFAREIAELVGEQQRIQKRILPIKTDQYPTPAKRPQYSVLESARVTDPLLCLPNWRATLRLAMNNACFNKLTGISFL